MENALYKVAQFLYINLYNDNKSVVMFLYFNTVHQYKLLNMLLSFTINNSTKNWYKNYLKNRK